MKLEANITRFAPRDGYICDATRHDKAIAEAEDYDFRFISPGYFLCIHGGTAYAISEYKGKIGCACADMTYRCKGKEICKHGQIFLSLDDYPSKPIDTDMEQLLKAAGWAGKKLSPPDRPEQRRRPKLPNIHDPARKPQPQAATRADQHKRYASMTPEEIIRETPQEKLETYASRGAPLAITEVERRIAEQEVSA